MLPAFLLRWLLLCIASLLLAAPPSGALALELRVELAGVGGELEKNVRGHLSILREQQTVDQPLTLGRIRYLHRQAEREIRQALQPFGYFRPEIERELSELMGSGGTSWLARYRVNPGPALTVATVDYALFGEGAKDPNFPARFALQPGDVLDQRLYEQAKTRLLETAAQQGYMQAELRQNEIRVELAQYRADILLHFDTGPRHYFGEVRFEQGVMSPDFLARYSNFPDDAPYDLDRVLQLQGTLLATDYFKRVEIVPLLAERSADYRVPLRVSTTPNPRHKLRFGVGFATDNGPRVTLDWALRRIGRYGHKGNLLLTLSSGLRKLSGEYRIPLQLPASDYFSIAPEFVYYDTASRQGELFQLQLAHSVAGQVWRRILGLDIKYEDYEIADELANETELVPHISWARTVTDDPVYTRNGRREKLTLLGAVDGLLSSVSYLQGRASGKWVRSFGDGYRFLGRTDLGASLVSNLLDLSGSRRFFAGGDNSIRGFALDEVGPKNDAGEVVGGRFLAVGSLELERRLRDKWSLALFIDAGNAYDPDYHNEIAYAAGVGLRWRSPVGQIRLDLASALSEPDDPLRLHLVIGPDL